MVMNYKTEPSFSHMKRIKNSNRKTMRQDGMKSISQLMIAADLLRQINFEDLLIGCCFTSIQKFFNYINERMVRSGYTELDFL